MIETEALEPILRLVEEVLSDAGGQPAMLGICGSQGSGKSTVSEVIATHVPGTAVLSLDDLYLTLDERIKLARTVHPLLRTRGVPGTHDIALGNAVLDAIIEGREVALPRFDKAKDCRSPPEDWPLAPAEVRLVILEGWCVGARPQTEDALADPINALEREEDTDGTWRRYVNSRLAGEYQSLFGRLDALVLLAAPGFKAVLDWRIQQEDSLRARSPIGSSGLMDNAQIARFIAHYERLTRAILEEMPARADLTLDLDKQRRVTAMRRP